MKCLENEGVKFVFGIPGEENIRFVDALSRYLDSFHPRSPRTGCIIHGGDVRSCYRKSRSLRGNSGPWSHKSPSGNS